MIRIHARAFAFTLLLPVGVLGACNDSKASSNEPARSAMQVAQSATPVQQRSAAKDQALSESDQISLEMADNACKAEDFRAFFDAFITSKDVRLKYSSAKISYAVLGTGGKKISEQSYDPASYPHLPITMLDYYYKSVKPARAGDEDEYIEFEINQSSNNDFSVDWWRVHYDGQSDGGDNLGNPIDANGKPIPKGAHPDPEGQLLFRPTADCWELSEDIRWERKK